MKPGDRIETPDGPATVKYIEDYSRKENNRVCVELDDKSKFMGFDPCYFLNEILKSYNKQLTFYAT